MAPFGSLQQAIRQKMLFIPSFALKKIKLGSLDSYRTYDLHENQAGK